MARQKFVNVGARDILINHEGDVAWQVVIEQTRRPL